MHMSLFIPSVNIYVTWWNIVFHYHIRNLTLEMSQVGESILYSDSRKINLFSSPGNGLQITDAFIKKPPGPGKHLYPHTDELCSLFCRKSAFCLLGGQGTLLPLFPVSSVCSLPCLPPLHRSFIFCYISWGWSRDPFSPFNELKGVGLLSLMDSQG